MSAPRNAAGKGEAGFVLVGVVIMVLALTILGLSLFSLSNYEAQFMQRSVDQQQALQSALGGLERAKYALSVAGDSLAQVKMGLPLENVFYARATQLKPGFPPVQDTSHLVDWTGDSIHIEVAARVNDVTRWAEGWFRPVYTDNFYKRVMTSADSVNVNAFCAGFPATGTVVISGSDSVWQSCQDVSWRGLTAPGLYGVRVKPLPLPAVSSFISAHLAGATSIAPVQAAYSLGAAGVVTYNYTEDLTNPEFSIRNNALSPTITVNGQAIWMLPRGIRFEHTVTIQSGGDPNACLVIIARDGRDSTYHDPGAIWFFAGLQSTIPLVLVSDGSAKLEQFNATTGASSATHLSIFSGKILLTGPQNSPPGHFMVLSHGLTPTDVNNMDHTIDVLMAAGALPNPASANGARLSLLPGTWRITQ